MSERRRPLFRRALVGAFVAAGASTLLAPAALAHIEFDVSEAAPGTIIAMQLLVEDENPDAATVSVELRFPEALAIVDLPAVDGWTAEPVEPTATGEAIGVLWTRPSGEPGEDPQLPLTIGPLPATEGRLQFKVLQTYADGQVDAWIDEWPAGAPEPAQPGPVLDLIADAPGTIPETATTVAPEPTTAVTTAVTTADTVGTTADTPADTTATTAAPVIAPPPTDPAPASTPGSTSAATTDATDAAAGGDEDDSSDTIVIVGVIVAVAIAAGIGIVVLRNRR